MSNTPWSADLAARLHLPQGDSYQRFYAFVPSWCFWTIVVVACAAACWLAVRSRAVALWPAAAGRFTSRRSVLAIAAFCLLLVAAYDGAGFIHGFFRQDDFSFLQVAREPERLLQQMNLYHNDHLYPLYRLEVWSLVRLAGPDAEVATLARWFNAVNVLTCSGLLAAGAWLLHELGGSRLAVLALPFFTWTWPGWGEFTAGYYTLSAYLQMQGLSFAAAAAAVRGFRLRSTCWLLASLLFAALAAAIDTSGAQALLTLALIGLASTWPQVGQHRRFWIAAAALFATVCIYYLAIGPHPYSPRELVQNPHATPVSVTKILSGLVKDLPAVFSTFLVSGSGLFVAWITPTFLEFALDNQRIGAGLAGGVMAAEYLLLPVLVVFGWRILRTFPVRERLVSLALVASALVGVALLLAARTRYAITTPTPLWHAKYLAGPIAWLAVGVLFAIDRRWLARPSPAPRTPVCVFGAVVVGAWLTASLWNLERTLLPTPMAYVARGRWGNVDSAKTRAAQYRSFLSDLTQIAAIEGTRHLVLPPPDSWAPSFFSHYPALEWGSDYTPTGVTHLFWDLPAAAPHLRLTGRWADPAQIPADTLKQLGQLSWLQRTDSSKGMLPQQSDATGKPAFSP